MTTQPILTQQDVDDRQDMHGRGPDRGIGDMLGTNSEHTEAVPARDDGESAHPMHRSFGIAHQYVGRQTHAVDA